MGFRAGPALTGIQKLARFSFGNCQLDKSHQEAAQASLITIWGNALGKVLGNTIPQHQWPWQLRTGLKNHE